MTAQCLICNKAVEDAEQEGHLATAHPAPAGGFHFDVDGRKFFTDRPSMLVVEVKRLANVAPNYHFVQHGEQWADNIYLADAQAVDLTRQPRFGAIPPATM